MLQLEKIKLDKTTEHLSRCLKHLASWQINFKEQTFEPSPEQLTEIETKVQIQLQQLNKEIITAIEQSGIPMPKKLFR